MTKNRRWLYVTLSGMRKGLKINLFELYVYLCLGWVMFALGLDIYIILKYGL